MVAQEAEVRVGDVCPHDDPNTIPLDIWRYVLDEQGNKTGQLKRERWRTLGEVYDDLEKRLRYLEVCDKCGKERNRARGCGWAETHKDCGGEFASVVGEYIYGPRDAAACNRPVPNYRWIACYPVTGGNEGHYVHVEFVFETKERQRSDDPWSLVSLAHAKTFSGFDHAAALALRIAKMLGA